MELDEDKIDEAALAILSLTLHYERMAWKQIDWDITNRLYEKGFISDPVNKNKSVVFTDEGLEAAEVALKKLFSKNGSNQ